MVRCLVIAVALAGCGDKQLDDLKAVRDEVCACKTVACGEAAMTKVPQDKLKSTHAMPRVANEMLDCIAKLDEANRPSTDPDASDPESAGSASGETP